MATENFQSKQDYVAQVIEAAISTGWYSDEKHTISVDGPQSLVEVRDCTTKMIVAYSSTKADFDQSVVEFVNDYFV